MADSSTRNRLADEKSPYLLQHADNPVDWYPWGEEAFRRAREEDRPVFVSIGYSTCHWCHVMAHESFEDPGVAELLNEHFVSVKVDREERPDVDGVYMTACQMMTGRGGWPLTIVTTPDRRPFFAGTYFPREGRGGRPGLVRILRRIAELWETDRERVLESARRTTSALEEGMEVEPGSELGADTLEEAYRQLAGTFDAARGGFGQAPKFPTPHNLLFLLRHWDRTGEERALEMVRSTLDAMRRGGVYDHVGFGFHRYSTDERWLLPHFEKMLYDQALLALAYLEAHQATGEEAYARTAREIFAYLLRDMRDPGGGFHSAEDADSEGGEGAFYVWSLEELEEVLSPDELALARDAYGVRPEGNYVEEATGERTGDNILHLTKPLEELAEDEGVAREELDARLETIREKLFRARTERPRPHKDDKVLTDWNGLVIGALARGGAVLEEERYLEAARDAAGFLLEELRDEEGRLLHRWREGEAAVPATASDYAFLIFGLLELYEASLAPRWLAEAVRLDRESVERCWDEEKGGFYTSAEDVTDLPVRQKEVHDGALPSANSVAHWNAGRLDRLTGGTDREERALSLERVFAGRVDRAPGAHTAFMVGLDFRVGEGHEVVLTGDRVAPELEEMLGILRRGFWPRTVVLFRPATEGGEEARAEVSAGAGETTAGPADEAPSHGAEGADLRDLSPFVADQRPVDGRPTAYVCTDFACREPTTDPEEMRRQLEGRAGG